MTFVSVADSTVLLILMKSAQFVTGKMILFKIKIPYVGSEQIKPHSTKHNRVY